MCPSVVCVKNLYTGVKILVFVSPGYKSRENNFEDSLIIRNFDLNFDYTY